MNKPWIGIVATILLFAGGLLEFMGGNRWLGGFLMVMALVSFFLRRHFMRKMDGKDGSNS